MRHDLTNGESTITELTEQLVADGVTGTDEHTPMVEVDPATAEDNLSGVWMEGNGTVN